MNRKKTVWNEATFDKDIDKNPDWYKAYAVGIANLPLFPSRKIKRFLRDVQAMEGFIGIRPEYPYGTLLVFDTLNNAKAAKNVIETLMQVGKEIGEIYLPKNQ